MRIQLIDPSAFTPPYDRALARALAAAGEDVELITSRFLYGPVPEAEGYKVDDSLYRRIAKRGLEAKGRRAFKAVEHILDMRRLRKMTDADVVHYQWLTMPGIDRRLISPRRPRVMTAHYILPLEPTRRQVESAKRVFGSMDAVIAHSASGASRLREVVGLPDEQVREIPHSGICQKFTIYHQRLQTSREQQRGVAGGSRVLRPQAATNLRLADGFTPV